MIKTQKNLPMPTTLYAHRPEDAFQIRLLLQHPNGYDWFMEKYNDLYMQKEYELQQWEGFIDADQVDSCPFVIRNKISKQHLSLINADIINNIIQLIDNDNYILCHINKFYIPNFTEYKSLKILHRAIISGYDNELGVLTLSDFIDGKFKTFDCYYEDYIDAYMNCSLSELDVVNTYMQKDIFMTVLDEINIIKINKNIPYHFDIKRFKEGIVRYLNSKSPNENGYMTYGFYMDDFDWGISIYDNLLLYIEKTGNVPLRMMYLLMMNKSVMTDKIKYLIDNHYLSDITFISKNDTLVNKTKLILNISIKTMYSKQPLTPEKINSLLYKIREVKELDCDFIKELLNVL